MKFGVGVEGPSDLAFWDKVLHKSFPGCRFDIRNMKNREKLIRETPVLYESFKDLHYNGGFILVDRDDDPCVTAVLNLFEEAMRSVFRKPQAERFLFLSVAVKEIESWYLADEQAIKAVIKGCTYTAPAETGTFAKGKVKQLIREHRGPTAGFNELGFAKEIAPKFGPARAVMRSQSFKVENLPKAPPPPPPTDKKGQQSLFAMEVGK
jgi:hypothetical protein